MKIIRKFIFDDDDVEILEDFLMWIQDNFANDSDWETLAEYSRVDVETMYQLADQLCSYMKRNMTAER